MRILKSIIVALLFIGATTVALAQEEQKEKFPGHTFTFSDINDEKIVIDVQSDLRFIFENAKDKVVMLNFFGKQCPPCLMEIPSLVKTQEKYKKDFEIIGLQVQTPMTNKEAQAFVKEKNINYTVAEMTPEMEQFIGFIMTLTNWKGMIPFMIMFDKDGKIAYQPHTGMISQEGLEEAIQNLIPKKDS